MALCAARWLSLGRCRRWAPYSRLLLGAPSRPLRLLRRRFSAATSSMAAARLRLSPPLRSLFDEPLAIGVEGLRPRQEVTLRASLEDESGEAFESRAFYRADADGHLDLSRSPALEGGGGGGGSFSGLDPMGLLWSLQPRKKPFWRLVKRDVRRPFVLGLEVLDGHDSEARLDAAPALAKAEHERGFLRRGVRRIPVREGKVRATLFLPPGDGPFPGIIDIYGLGGGLPEHRASLLAGYDFAVLALAYYGYEDLPETLIELHLEYFEAAVHYMLKHPMVKGPGIGLLGHSKGGDICISMACFLKGIAAIVTVNGSIANIGSVLNYKDVTIPPLSFDMKRVKIDKNTGLADITDVLDNPFESPGNQSLIPLEKAEGHFLFIVGKDDRNFKSEFFAAAASKYLQAHGREKPKIICYPGAGHYIEPPYMPMCPASKHVMVGRLVTWGGEPRAHAAAQVDAWQQIQAFFHKHLGVKQCERNSKL